MSRHRFAVTLSAYRMYISQRAVVNRVISIVCSKASTPESKKATLILHLLIVGATFGASPFRKYCCIYR